MQSENIKSPSSPYPVIFFREVDWVQYCYVIFFEKYRFHPSTRKHENGVLKKFHSGERFQKVAFSVTVFIEYVWTEAV